MTQNNSYNVWVSESANNEHEYLLYTTEDYNDAVEYAKECANNSEQIDVEYIVREGWGQESCLRSFYVEED